jgi:hypothetical protein
VQADHGKQAEFGLLCREGVAFAFSDAGLNQSPNEQEQYNPTKGTVEVLKSCEHGSKITPQVCC